MKLMHRVLELSMWLEITPSNQFFECQFKWHYNKVHQDIKPMGSYAKEKLT